MENNKKVFCIGNGESRKDFDLEKLRSHGKIYGCNALYRDFTPDVLIAVDPGITHEIYHSGFAFKTECWFRNWKKQSKEQYSKLVYGDLEEEKIYKLKPYLTNHKENDKGNSTEFVVHGSSYKNKYNIYERYYGKPDKQIQMDREMNTSGLHISWIKKDKVGNVTDIQDGKDKGWSAGPTSAWIAIKQCQPKELYMIGFDFTSNTGLINNVYKGTDNYYKVNNAKTPDINWRNQWSQIIKENPNITFFKVNKDENMSLRTNMPLPEFNNFKNVKYTTYEKCFFNR